jgi:hypothetical protein
MKLWIRVDACASRDPKVAEFAEAIGDDVTCAFGRLILIWSGMAEHAADGFVGDETPMKGEGNADETPMKCLPNGILEGWAMWQPKRGKPRGTLARAFRRIFVTDGYVNGWAKRQGALIERMERDRTRKQPGNSAEIPRKERGNSTPTVRNGTVRKEETASVGSDDPPARRSGLTPTPAEAAVIAHDKALHPKRRHPDDKTLRALRRQLGVGFSVEEVKAALSVASEDPWCVKTGNHSIGYVCRDQPTLEKFLAQHEAENRPVVNADGNFDPLALALVPGGKAA